MRVDRSMNVGNRHAKQTRDLALRLAGDPHVDNLAVDPLALALHDADYTPPITPRRPGQDGRFEVRQGGPVDIVTYP